MWIELILIAVVVVYIFRLIYPDFWATILLTRPNGFPPGPLALPFVGNLPLILYYGSLHQTFQSLGNKFGPIFSVFIGPTPAVIFNSIDTIKETGKLDEFQGRADVPTFTLRDDTVDYSGGVVFSEGRIHEEQRKFVVKTLRQLNTSNVSIENIYMEEMTSLMEQLRSLVGQPIDIRHYFGETIENVLRKYLVGIPKQETKSVRDYKEIVLAPDNAMNTSPATVFFLSFYSKLAKLFPQLSGYNWYAREHKKSNEALRQIIEKHLPKCTGCREESPPTFINSYLDHIRSTTDKNSTFYGRTGLQNLTMVIKDLSGAGTDTISEQTKWFILYLLLNPEIREKIVEEIKSIVGFHRAPTKTDFNEMHYTQATLLEVMRISSLVEFGLFNKTLTTTTFRGFVIPKGTMVIRNAQAAHNDKNYWGDPQNFRPERFLDENGKFRRDENVLAFGSGRRACLGETLARFEMLYFITLFLQNFDLTVDSSRPTPTLEPIESIGLVAKPFRIVVHERYHSI